MSQPTGYNNLSVSQEFQTKYNPKLTIQTGSKSAAAMLEERNAQMNIIGGRTQGVTGYLGNTAPLRMKKSPSMEKEAAMGTALREEHVADLLADRNEQWKENTNVASHGTVEQKTG